MFDFDVRDLQAEGGSTDARRMGGDLGQGWPGPAVLSGPTDLISPAGARALGAAMDAAIDAAIDAIPRRPPLILSPTCSAGDALTAVAEHEQVLALVTSHGYLFGTVTDQRLVRHLDPGPAGRDGAEAPVTQIETLRRTPVWKLMQVEPETLRDTDSIGYALHKMGVLGARALPIVNAGGAPVGVLECRDLLAFLVTSWAAFRGPSGRGQRSDSVGQR